MSEIQNTARVRNPWALHFQKIGLELKCAICLNLLNKPTLLPCNHIFCKFCIPELGSECPTCNHLYVDGEMRSATFLENIITIYKSLDATIFPHLSNDSRKPLNLCRESVTIIDDKTRKKLNEVELHGSDTGSRDGSSGTYRAKRSVESDCDTAPGEIAVRTFHQDQMHTRDAKRQKKLNHGLSESVGKGLASPSDKIAVSNCNGELLDAPNVNRTVCAFCHSSKQTEWTGSLLYYAKGKEVVGDVTALSKAIPVHSKCLEWYKIHGDTLYASRLGLDVILIYYNLTKGLDVILIYYNLTKAINIMEIGKFPEIKASFPSSKSSLADSRLLHI